MKYLFSLFIIVFFTYCKNKETKNEFDEIIHYQISDETALKNKESERFFTIFTSLKKHKLGLQTFEKELIDFGFTKHTFHK